MTGGRLIGVVGPSGVGKDTVMAALAAARPGLHVVRRCITRSEEMAGECFTGLDDAEDAALARWTCDTLRDLGEFHIGDIDPDPHFARYHDAAEYGVLACDCHDVTLCFAPINVEVAA